MSVNKKLIGICTGGSWEKKKSKSKYGKPLLKEFNCDFVTENKFLVNCPKCGYALFWSKTGCGYLTLEELDEMSEREDEVLGDVTFQKTIKLQF